MIRNDEIESFVDALVERGERADQESIMRYRKTLEDRVRRMVKLARLSQWMVLSGAAIAGLGYLALAAISYTHPQPHWLFVVISGVTISGLTLAAVGVFGYFTFHGRSYAWVRAGIRDSMIIEIGKKLDKVCLQIDALCKRERIDVPGRKSE